MQEFLHWKTLIAVSKVSGLTLLSEVPLHELRNGFGGIAALIFA